MNNGIFAAVAAVLIFTTLTSNTFAHASPQKRYNDGNSAGQDYAARDYSNCDSSNTIMTRAVQMIKSILMNSVMDIHSAIRSNGIH
jgi:hypothetical protein